MPKIGDGGIESTQQIPVVYSNLSHLNNCGQPLALPQADSCGHLLLWHCIGANSCDSRISLQFLMMMMNALTWWGHLKVL